MTRIVILSRRRAANWYRSASDAGGLFENVQLVNNVADHNGLNSLIVGGWGIFAPSRTIRAS